MTTPERWARIDRLFHLALEREAPKRAEFLVEQCSGDTTLRKEVESLLAAHGEAGSFLEKGAEAPQETLPEGAMLGAYRIAGLIGRGGMGEVYRARDTRLDRDVAVKVLPAPAAALSRRFETEALLTARVQHPAVVPIYERGQLPDGKPFYAMKLVSGRSLSELVKERAQFAQRMALLPNVIAVAEALAQAHAQRIVHRDVKPGNVMVGEFGETVLLDWGLAKSLDSDAPEPQQEPSPQAAPDRTALGTVIGTPAYMSPEQARGQRVDERADVFSLGATLYQVLCGRAPYEGGALASAEQARFTPLLVAQPQAPVELAAIVNRAMDADPARRYPTARELAEDLRRFQTGQLVLSHRYSTRELLLRWARRHRTMLVAGAACVALLAAGAAVSVRRIVAERDRANSEAESSRRVSEFMTRMFKVSDPGEARGNAVTAREILDKASAQVDGELSSQPQVKANLMDAMAQVYASLGLYAKARPLAEKAVALRTQVQGLENPATLSSMTSLAVLENLQGQYAASQALSLRVMEVQLRTLGPEHPDTLTSSYNIARADLRLGHFVPAEARLRSVAEVRARVLGPDHPDTLATLHSLAFALNSAGRYAESEAVYLETLRRRRQVLGPDHPDTLTSINGLAIAILNQRRFEEAQKLFEQELAIQQRVIGPDHPDTLGTINNVAWVRLLRGDLAGLEKVYLDLLDTERRVLGAEHPTAIWSSAGLGTVYMGMRRFGEAEKFRKHVLDMERRVLGREHPKTLTGTTELADAEAAAGHAAEAEADLRTTLDAERRVLGPEHPDVMMAMLRLAMVKEQVGGYAESEKVLLEMLEIARRKLGPRHALVGRGLFRLAGLATRQGDRAKAAGLLRQASEGGFAPLPAGLFCIESCIFALDSDDAGIAALAR